MATEERLKEMREALKALREEVEEWKAAVRGGAEKMREVEESLKNDDKMEDGSENKSDVGNVKKCLKDSSK